MKNTLLHSPAKLILLFGIIVIPLLFVPGGVKAETIEVLDSSFEDTGGNIQVSLIDPPEWTPYYENLGTEEEPNNISHLEIGTLYAKYDIQNPVSTWFTEETEVDGNRVLLLYKGGNQNASGAFGVEQEVDATFDTNHIYRLTVDVGNPASSTVVPFNPNQNPTPYNLNGMPDYRIQLFAGDYLIAENDVSLEIPEGEFTTVSISSKGYHEWFAQGQPLRIRLLHMNTELGSEFDDENGVADPEVDFDNVRLESFYFREYTDFLGNSTKDFAKIDFSIEGETKSHRVLILGHGQSLQKIVKNAASGTELVVKRRIKSQWAALSKFGNQVLGESAVWLLEPDSIEIMDLVETLQLPDSNTDSGLILDLQQGHYSIILRAPDDLNVTAGIGIYELSDAPDSELIIPDFITPFNWWDIGAIKF